MASLSGQLQLIGTFKTAAAGVSTYTLAESSTDPMVINVSSLQAAGFRGVELEFLGNTASSAYSANAILVGSKIGGSSKIQVKVLGTVGLTTASSAATDLTTALGLTGTWYPMDTVELDDAPAAPVTVADAPVSVPGLAVSSTCVASVLLAIVKSPTRAPLLLIIIIRSPECHE